MENSVLPQGIDDEVMSTSISYDLDNRQPAPAPDPVPAKA